VSGDGIKLGLSGNITGKAYLNLEVRFIDFNEVNGAPGTAFLDAGLTFCELETSLINSWI
jgi:hypothetical protein